MMKSDLNPEPRSWVRLKGHDHNSETAKSYCQFIKRFYWRPRDVEKNELHIVFDSGKQYKYYGVPRSLFNEAWSIAYNPSDSEMTFGQFFREKIKESFEFEKEEF